MNQSVHEAVWALFATPHSSSRRTCLPRRRRIRCSASAPATRLPKANGSSEFHISTDALGRRLHCVLPSVLSQLVFRVGSRYGEVVRRLSS
jgi:hypothetical protein